MLVRPEGILGHRELDFRWVARRFGRKEGV
jgi:hypothetical protein